MQPRNIKEALEAIKAAGMASAVIEYAENPDVEDDEIILRPNVSVQVSASSAGLAFHPNVWSDSEQCMWHGAAWRHPVSAAQDAERIAAKHSI